MSYGTAQTKSVSKQGACAECAITTHLATLKVCILGCFIDNATPPDMTATALQEVAQGTHKNPFFIELQMCQNCSSMRYSCLIMNQAWWVKLVIDIPMRLALQATEADLDTFSSHPCLNIVLECFIHHLRYVFAIFAFRSQADQQHPDMKT